MAILHSLINNGAENDCFTQIASDIAKINLNISIQIVQKENILNFITYLTFLLSLVEIDWKIDNMLLFMSCIVLLSNMAHNIDHNIVSPINRPIILFSRVKEKQSVWN